MIHNILILAKICKCTFESIYFKFSLKKNISLHHGTIHQSLIKANYEVRLHR